MLSRIPTHVLSALSTAAPAASEQPRSATDQSLECGASPASHQPQTVADMKSVAFAVTKRGCVPGAFIAVAGEVYLVTEVGEDVVRAMRWVNGAVTDPATFQTSDCMRVKVLSKVQERTAWSNTDMPWADEEKWMPAMVKGVALASIMHCCKQPCFQNLQDKVCIMHTPYAVVAMKAMKKGTLKIHWLMPTCQQCIFTVSDSQTMLHSVTHVSYAYSYSHSLLQALRILTQTPDTHIHAHRKQTHSYT